MKVSELHSISDFELLNKLRSGSDSALTLIYKKYWSALFISAHNILKDKQACEDIIQEIFIRLWDKREQLEITVSLKAYLFASMRYEVYRQIRKGTVREDIFEQLQERLQTPSVHYSLEHKELISQINSIIDTLPEKCKEVYKLSRESQLSHKEIASRLNISTKTVENQITKALRHLRTGLGDILTIEILYLLIR